MDDPLTPQTTDEELLQRYWVVAQEALKNLPPHLSDGERLEIARKAVKAQMDLDAGAVLGSLETAINIEEHSLEQALRPSPPLPAPAPTTNPVPTVATPPAAVPAAPASPSPTPDTATASTPEEQAQLAQVRASLGSNS